jgi:hypothetical protein
MNLWNFEHVEENNNNDDLNVDLGEIFNRVKTKFKKVQHQSSKNKPTSSSFALTPPQASSVSLPVAQDTRMNDTTYTNVVRSLLHTIRSGRDVCKRNTPVNGKNEEEMEKVIPTDYFDGMDEETDKILDRKFQLEDRTTTISALTKFDLEELAETPPSPGKEYDKFFIAGEIGEKQSKFNASIHEMIFEKQTGVTHSQRLQMSRGAKRVEKDLRSKYRKSAKIKSAVTATLSGISAFHQKKPRIMRATKKLKRKSLLENKHSRRKFE